MSESQGGAGRREVAYRLFAAEFDDADFSYSESDEERAPNYVVTPTGARVNRLFVVGVLTEVEQVNEDVLRARAVDPTGAFVVYAGQYQPEAMNFLERTDPPAFVAVTGKARTFQPDDADVVYTSIRPESVSAVDADTRDRWIVSAARRTIERVARMAEAKRTGLAGDELRAALESSGVDEGLAAGIPLALEHYGTTGDYLAALRDAATGAVEVVAGERDEADVALPAPDAGGDDALAPLAGTEIEAPEADETGGETEASPATDQPPTAAATGTAESSVDASGESSETDAEAASSVPGEAVVDATENTSTGVDSGEPDAGRTGVDESETAETDTVETGTPESDATEAGAPEDAGATETEDAGDLEDFEPEFELDESEREEIEDEYGTEFQSGTEVDEPGEADIETPEPDEEAPTAGAEADAGAAAPAASETAASRSNAASEPDPATEPEAAIDSGDGESEDAATVGEAAESDAEAAPSHDETAAKGAEESVSAEREDSASAEDVDLEDAVIDAMEDLDDGEGAERESVVAAVVDRYGADPGDVEDAIQDALMDGRCYEPDDTHLKSI